MESVGNSTAVLGANVSPTFINILSLVLLGISTTVGVFANFTALRKLVHKPEIRTKFRATVSLLLASILMCGSAAPLQMADMISNFVGWHNGSICTVLQFFFYWTDATILMSFAVIAIERRWQVKAKFGWVPQVCPRLNTMIISSWVLPLPLTGYISSEYSKFIEGHVDHRPGIAGEPGGDNQNIKIALQSVLIPLTLSTLIIMCWNYWTSMRMVRCAVNPVQIETAVPANTAATSASPGADAPRSSCLRSGSLIPRSATVGDYHSEISACDTQSVATTFNGGTGQANLMNEDALPVRLERTSIRKTSQEKKKYLSIRKALRKASTMGLASVNIAEEDIEENASSNARRNDTRGSSYDSVFYRLNPLRHTRTGVSNTWRPEPSTSMEPGAMLDGGCPDKIELVNTYLRDVKKHVRRKKKKTNYSRTNSYHCNMTVESPCSSIRSTLSAPPGTHRNSLKGSQECISADLFLSGSERESSVEIAFGCSACAASEGSVERCIFGKAANRSCTTSWSSDIIIKHTSSSSCQMELRRCLSDSFINCKQLQALIRDDLPFMRTHRPVHQNDDRMTELPRTSPGICDTVTQTAKHVTEKGAIKAPVIRICRPSKPAAPINRSMDESSTLSLASSRLSHASGPGSRSSHVKLNNWLGIDLADRIRHAADTAERLNSQARYESEIFWPAPNTRTMSDSHRAALANFDFSKFVMRRFILLLALFTLCYIPRVLLLCFYDLFSPSVAADLHILCQSIVSAMATLNPAMYVYANKVLLQQLQTN